MADISKITNGGTTYDVKDGATRETVTNAMANHGIGTMYTETVLEAMTLESEGWQDDQGDLTYPLTGYDINLIPEHTYIVTMGETEFITQAIDYESGIVYLTFSTDDRSFEIWSLPSPDVPYILAAYNDPIDTMTFSIVEKTINSIDKMFNWDAVFFLDIENAVGKVIKGSQAEIYAKLTSDLPVVSVLAIAKIADQQANNEYRYKQCRVNMYTSPSERDVVFDFWTETPVETTTWYWDISGALWPD